MRLARGVDCAAPARSDPRRVRCTRSRGPAVPGPAHGSGAIHDGACQGRDRGRVRAGRRRRTGAPPDSAGTGRPRSTSSTRRPPRTTPRRGVATGRRRWRWTFERRGGPAMLVQCPKSSLPRPTSRLRAAPQPASMTLPAVPLRDNVVFPSQLAPLAAGRPRSVAALEAAVNGDGRVVLAIQRDAARDEASLDDVHTIAVIAHVGAFRRLPGGGAHALVEGKERVRIDAFDASGDAWIATVTPVVAGCHRGYRGRRALRFGANTVCGLRQRRRPGRRGHRGRDGACG